MDWQTDVNAAFAVGRPVLMYWGANWCPPCNRAKAAIFSHPGFAQGVTLLHIDGDAPGAQLLGERFRLRSYPTLVVLRADGTEVTRLPCEVDGARFAQLLALALASRTTVAEALRDTLGGKRTLSNAEWSLLAFYSWDTDENALLQGRELGATLTALVANCPVVESKQRLAWHALFAKAAIGTQAVEAVLANPRAQFDVVTNYASTLVRQMPELMAAWAQALAQLENDPTMWVGDQLAALRARVRLARLGGPAAPAQDAPRALDGVTDQATRHFMVNTAAGVLSDAGLLDEAEALLLAELDRSHAPYYFMQNLAGIAKKRGDAAGVAQWYGRAWKEAVGPSTRLQWGATYLLALADKEMALEVARQVLEEAAALPDGRAQRNLTQILKITG
ncbi:MAG: thioredoxin fold domain-containing protein [Pseudomonadota bacterium]